MTGQPDLRQLMNEVMNLIRIPHQPEPSRPTTFIGAPHIGTDWRNAWDDMPLAANNAFGEDPS